jgi:hypothetical protein
MISFYFYLMKHCLLIVTYFCLMLNSHAQTDSICDSKTAIDRFFLPAFELGYVHNTSDQLLDGIVMKTSIEYRLSNIRGWFFRANYDTYDVRFSLEQQNGLTNVIKGTAFFWDLVAGAGYRTGNQRWRGFLLAQAGVKYYDYPTQSGTDANAITISMDGKRAGIMRLTLGAEYYINAKTAFTMESSLGHIFSKEHFWQSGNQILGLSVGITTSMN